MSLGQFTLSQFPVIDTVLESWNEQGLEKDLYLCIGLFREQLRLLMEDKVEMFGGMHLPVDLGEPPETAKAVEGLIGILNVEA